MAIRIEHEELYARAGDYSSESEDMGSKIGRLDNLMNTLQETWEGEAADAFLNQYEELKPGLLQVEGLLEDISLQLKKIADTMQDQDQAIASGIVS